MSGRPIKRTLRDTTRAATSTEVQSLRHENSQLKKVVAEIVPKNRVLKKICGPPARRRSVRVTRGLALPKVPSTAGGGRLTVTSERRTDRYGRYIRASDRLDRVVLSTRLSPKQTVCEP